MRPYLALVRNELRLYRSQSGLLFALILSLSLLAIFRFALPAGAAENHFEVFPIVAYCIAALQTLLMAIAWESDGYAFRFYAMSGVSLSALFFAKTTVSLLLSIPLWIFCLTGYYLFFPVVLPADLTPVILTALPLGVALAPAGQLVAAIAQHSTQKNFLAISLFLPLCLPVLIAATGRLGALTQGLDTDRYDALLVAAALVFLGAGNLLYAYLFEE